MKYLSHVDKYLTLKYKYRVLHLCKSRLFNATSVALDSYCSHYNWLNDMVTTAFATSHQKQVSKGVLITINYL